MVWCAPVHSVAAWSDSDGEWEGPLTRHLWFLQFCPTSSYATGRHSLRVGTTIFSVLLQFLYLFKEQPLYPPD